MTEGRSKLAVISALRHEPSFEGLQKLRLCSDRQARHLLRWLDESGLALYFLSRLRQYDQAAHLPAFFRKQLGRRLDSNRERSAAILREVGDISAALTARGVPHALLKGHSLVPDFCDRIELRHQSDIDILVVPESVHDAGVVMRELGFFIQGRLGTGEMQFSKPRYQPPSIDDDIYAPVFHLEIELHTSIWENADHVALTVPNDCLTRSRVRQIQQVSFSALSPEDLFIGQILHAFRHILGSWLRVSWLFEIHSFVVRYSRNDSVWRSIQARTSMCPDLRNAFGLVLQLTNQLFQTPVPKTMRDWCVDPLPASFRQWISQFGLRWALSGLSGSKLSLLIHAEFIPDAHKRRLYVCRRLFPLKGRPTIGPMKLQGGGAKLAARVAQVGFVAKRAIFHVVSLGSFGIDALRWNYILHEVRKERALSS